VQLTFVKERDERWLNDSSGSPCSPDLSLSHQPPLGMPMSKRQRKIEVLFKEKRDIE